MEILILIIKKKNLKGKYYNVVLIKKIYIYYIKYKIYINKPTNIPIIFD